ncbi:hypothetical protein CQ059_21895 [Brucella pseudogrignonensis]|nr:hypothetical protein A8A54_22905 [Brucella pseudogrignonensis]PQZ39262.1 hypothetical protein CQ059_21895 [Brucella pseudogrignonensis]PRA35902.1 hypothetical protein CQ063_22740 [Brucella pseudogrignonensis]PRA62973.1 hypothetical protein CQ055_21070 [Brucella pseudogrignonensis]
MFEATLTALREPPPPAGRCEFAALRSADNMPVDSGNVSGPQTYCRMLANGACAKLILEG